MYRAVLLACVLAACGGDDGGTTIDAAVDAPPNDGRVHVDDGAPTRMPCTSSFGAALTNTPTFGRLDGYLVAIVPPSGGSACNADSSHVHLQIRMNGAIYDVAVTVQDTVTNAEDVHTMTRDIAPPVNLPWAEGWHTGLLVDYVSVGVHSADLTLQTKAELVSTLQSDLATANHISIYATTYGSDGMHLVHRNGGGHDGVIVTDPQSIPAHVRFFSFSDQSF
jgi:hypothetical protein